MTIILFSIAIILGFLLPRVYILKTERFLSKVIVKPMLIFHISLAILFIAFFMIMVEYDLHIRGRFTLLIILILTTITGTLIYWFNNKNELNKIVRIGILAIGILGFPITVFATIVEFTDREVYHNEEKYRLEDTFEGIMAIAELPELFVKNGLFEKEYELSGPYIPKEEIDSIKIFELENDLLEISFYHSDTDYIESPYIIKIELNDKN